MIKKKIKIERKLTIIKDTEELQLKNYLILQNIKLDYASLKIILYVFYAFPELKILKFSNNDFK